ncbi:MAG TPA: hypothetical protein VHA14_11610, partial [Bryobacteraceae bacterium]|nr:hypothetical protein [Bryobacteraceae bacterium]
MQERYSHDFAFGISCTYSKAMGRTTYTPGIANQDEWNYGYISTDRTHNLQVSHTYDIPNVGKYFAFKPVGAVLGNWEFSGITEVQSGAPSNPGCGLT